MPEMAHQIGLELCKKILKNEYEFVLSTHIDKGHIHNHIIFNKVIWLPVNAISPTRQVTIRSVPRVISSAGKITFPPLMNTTKATIKNTRQAESLGMKMNRQRKGLLGKASFSLTLIE